MRQHVLVILGWGLVVFTLVSSFMERGIKTQSSQEYNAKIRKLVLSEQKETLRLSRRQLSDAVDDLKSDRDLVDMMQKGKNKCPHDLKESEDDCVHDQKRIEIYQARVDEANALLDSLLVQKGNISFWDYEVQDTQSDVNQLEAELKLDQEILGEMQADKQTYPPLIKTGEDSVTQDKQALESSQKQLANAKAKRETDLTSTGW
jgi:homoserine dehydrogenase